MRITVDIEAGQLRQIQKITGQRKKSPAVTQALARFLHQEARRRFLDQVLSGKTDYALTNEQLEARDVYDAH